MSIDQDTNLSNLLKNKEPSILSAWIQEQEKTFNQKMKASELADQCKEFLKVFLLAVQSTDSRSITAPGWEPVKSVLSGISRSRSIHGFSPSQTAMFVFSLKQPITNELRKEYEAQPQRLFESVWNVSNLLDQLGLFTTEIYQKTREEVILRQQEEMMELSTPVVKLWDGILALPLIGTLDSSRTQVVMESLLQKIVETGSEVAIIDITGVPTVDTLVAQHLMKTVTAARLMGAECIISGIRPQIAATIVHLGVDLLNITTKATLADAFVVALQKSGRTVGRIAPMKAR